MFSYYGSKSKVVDLYPSPKFGKIIEPFAGSARYSLKYFDRDVILVDKYEKLISIWLWLQKCSPSDILKLPAMKAGENTDNFNFDCPEAKWFMGFIIQGGVNAPRKTVSSVGNFGQAVETEKKRIASELHKIKHWKIMVGSYDEIQNQEATWFIDPPYQFGGEYYIKSNKHLNFDKLGEWCQSRSGQVIVCENTKATWLPFYPMRDMQGSQYKTTEAIWSNYRHDFQAVQSSMFEPRHLTPLALDGGESAASQALSPQSGESTPEVDPAATQRR